MSEESKAEVRHTQPRDHPVVGCDVRTFDGSDAVEYRVRNPNAKPFLGPVNGRAFELMNLHPAVIFQHFRNMKLPEKLGIAGTSVSLMGISFGWIIFPWLLKKEIGKIKALAPGSESREFWEKVPFPIDFRVYVFNVTNPMEVHKGEIPIVQEIGPYQYLEWKEKTEIVDYDEDDSVSFKMQNTWIYDREKTAPLTGEEVITIPHPILLGLVMAAERDKPGVLGMINKALPILFNKPETIFIQTTVNNLLWDGIVLNCTTKDFSASAICAVLKKETPDLEIVSPTICKMSILKMKNATSDPKKLCVSRGILDPRRVGEMLKINGKKRQTVWRGRPCNDLEGTDSTVFPSIVKPEDDIVSFNLEICRSIPAKYVGPSSYKSISSLRYNASFGDMSTDPSLKCLCINDTTCYKRGLMDIMKCAGVPLVASLPHFYDCHEDYLKAVKGLHPDQEKHGIIVDMEPNTGTPLYAKKRIQFSFPLHRVNKIEITQTLPTAYLPLVWLEESVELPDMLVKKLENELFLVIRIVDVVKWVLTVLGAAIMSGGVGLYYKRHNSIPISPTLSRSQKFGSTDYLSGVKKQETEMGHTNLGYI